MKIADDNDYFEGLVVGQDKDIVASTYRGSSEVILNIENAGAYLTPQQARQLGRYLICASKLAKKEAR